MGQGIFGHTNDDFCSLHGPLKDSVSIQSKGP